MASLQPPVAQISDDAASERLERITLAFAAAVAVAYIVLLIGSVALRIWPYDNNGRLLPLDFTVFWTAGHLALHGMPHVAYTPHLIHLAEERTIGHSFPANIPWGYPPLFLCIVAVLACLPYVVSFVLWNCTTFVMFGATVARIANRPIAFFAAIAAPWSFACLHIGQDGLFSGSIVGAVLLLLNRRPALAGLLLGLLTFKPQLGILFPVALAFGRHWRAMTWACVGTLACTGVSVAFFGDGTLLEFFRGLLTFADGFLINNARGWYNGWNNFQSLYALARWVGIEGSICWSLQIAATIGCVAVLAALWRSSASFSVKAAGLAAAIPVATPFVFVYDFPVLTVAIAFLWDHRRFDLVDCLAIVFAFLITSFAWSANPTAALAPLAIAMIVWRRVPSEMKRASFAPSGSVARSPRAFAS
ncbi:MAG TPA: glycosyltransferase family 87 protein [Rhizomicrobium sp.]|nr:glycosyltransferase family 87 protein [Rhizomicrobium sp.]